MMQFPCVLAYVIQRAVFENRFQDLRTIFSENFIPDSFFMHCKHSLLTFEIPQHCVNTTSSSACSIDYFFFFKISLTPLGY